MRKFYFVVACFLVFIIHACKTKIITAPKPPAVSIVVPPKPTSIIGLPIHINTAGIASSINKKFTIELYKDDKFDDNGNDNLKLTVLKRTDFIVNTANDGLTITAPLHIDFVYNIKVFGGFEKPISQSLNLTVIFNTTPSIDRDWNLNLNSKGKIYWDDLPVINLGITKLDLPQLFGAIIQGQVNKMASKIDQEVPKSVPLKKMVGDTWKSLAEPTLLDTAYNAWLVLKPKNIFITPITYTEQEMQIKLGIASIIEVVSGYKPTNDSFNLALPPLRQANQLNDEVKINLAATIAFDQINASINKQFTAKPMVLESNEYKINIKEAKAFAYGTKIMIAIDLEGKVQKGKMGKGIKGIVYVTGIPSYNPINKSIEIKQFDFDIKTRDILVKSASWLVNSKKFRENIEKQMVFSIADQLAEAKKVANEAVNKKWIDMIDINGTIKNIEPSTIYITPNALNINIITEGNLKVIMNGF
ncbi:MAG: DUF4403 family protein [Bacteroidota bacterium]